MSEFVLAYDHSQPGSAPRAIPHRWLGQPFARQWSTEKPRVDKGAVRKPADSATDKKE